VQTWVESELRSADLGDERLDARFRVLLDRMSLKPSLKFNAACRGKAEVQAAYRFVNHPGIDGDAVLRPHRDATLARMRQCPVVLVAQDTTEIDLTRRNERVAGAGPLGEGGGRLGFYLHPLLALTPDRLPLGLVGAEAWARDPAGLARPQKQKAARRKRTPIEGKESFRWLEGYRACREAARECPGTRVVCLSDSEGDIYECIAEGQAPAAEAGRRAEWIVRACKDRSLADAGGAGLFDAVAAGPALARFTLLVSKREPTTGDGRKRRRPRQERRARVTVRSGRVTLRGPSRPGGRLPDVAVNAVLVREEGPPEGAEAVEWLLLTSLPVGTAEEASLVAEYYCGRWEAEVYFRVLKSGCRVESSQLETAEGFRVYLALQMIVAWRVLYVLMLGRECPEVPCECVLEPDEWRAVYAVVKGQAPPQEAPPLGDVVPLIAALGGHLGRKGDGPPGPKAMWLGMQRMADLALGWRAFASVNPTTQ
jgi:hypothetical protein